MATRSQPSQRLGARALQVALLAAAGLLLQLLASPAVVAATTLTYKMAPHERACFYTEAKTKGEKLAFYFAVQSGGNFDVDFDVVDPRQVVVLKGNGERQGDYVISARQPGEYSLCFSNSMSTFADKVIDFDITAEHETPEAGAKSKLAESVGSIGSGEKKDKLQQTLASLHERASSVLSSLSTLQRNQRSMRTNEHRDLSVVKSTDSRIFWFAVVESGLIIGMAVLQVFVIQTFFSKSVRTRV